MSEQKGKRIIVKVGTHVVPHTENFKPAFTRLAAVVEEIVELCRTGNELVLVSSGAVGLGRAALNLTGKLELAQKLACAAVGQSRLMKIYADLFREFSREVAQVLVTGADFSDRIRYLNPRNTFDELLRLGVIPIVNENDTVSIAGIVDRSHAQSFDDNDTLSALVAGKLDADLLILLTNVDGVYDRNPAQYPDAQRIDAIQSLEKLQEISAEGQSELGRGGMASKLLAAKIASLCGVQTIISSGFIHRPISQALERKVGTLISPQEALSAHQRWFGLSSGHVGVITIDWNARLKLIQERKSLLSVGVRSIEGMFTRGAIVSIRDENGSEIGRGITGQSSATLIKTAGLRTQEAATFLQPGEKAEVIHRDAMVLFEEPIDAAS